MINNTAHYRMTDAMVCSKIFQVKMCIEVRMFVAESEEL